MKLATMPPEWAPQAFVQMIWPDAETDWGDMLREVRDCYARILAALTQSHEHVLLVVRHQLDANLLYNKEYNIRTQFLHLVEADYDDTWARDTAFITRQEQEKNILLNFKFNGWGEKFSALRDDQLNATILPHILHIFGDQLGYVQTENHLDFVLEGGSIESDGEGSILTTTHCLLAPHRNQPLSQREIETQLLPTLGAKQILWLQHGHIEGDDTDGHIDTLARFAPRHTILYVQDSSLSLMEQDLCRMRTADGLPYRLIPLPMPLPIYAPTDQHQLPATYANFLVINQAVLCPIYQQPKLDDQALRQIALAFPKRKIIPIDCRALIQQHGSLHCATMQYFSSPSRAVAL